jgi:hypothetical protein
MRPGGNLGTFKGGLGILKLGTIARMGREASWQEIIPSKENDCISLIN